MDMLSKQLREHHRRSVLKGVLIVIVGSRPRRPSANVHVHVSVGAWLISSEQMPVKHTRMSYFNCTNKHIELLLSHKVIFGEHLGCLDRHDSTRMQSKGIVLPNFVIIVM